MGTPPAGAQYGAQPGYYNPYYVPGAQPQPARRTSLLSIVGIVIGVLGVVTAVAVLFLHAPSRPTVAPPVPTLTAVPTTPPAAANTMVPTQQAQNTAVPANTQAAAPTQAAQNTAVPADTQVPAPAPTTTGGGGTTGGGTAFTAQTFSVQVPSGWKVAQQQNDAAVIAHTSGSSVDGFLYIFADQGSSGVSPQSMLQQSLTSLQKQYPDAKQCGDASQLAIGGVPGSVIPICYTITPQSGTALKALTLSWAGTNTAGTAMYALEETGQQSPPDFFNNTAPPVVQTISWTIK